MSDLYVSDLRPPVCRQLSEFITRGSLDPVPPAPVQGTTEPDCAPRGRRDSQDTLEDVDESVYDTITEPPAPLPAVATSVV